MKLRAILSLFVVSLFASQSAAQAPSIPKALEDWVEWSLDGDLSFRCTWDSGHICLWPSTLRVEANDKGATFRINVVAEDKGSISLPGDANYWPERIRVDGKETAIAGEDTPSVELTKGSHTIEGTILWAEAPNALPVPKHFALLRLFHAGKENVVRRRDDGALWLNIVRKKAADPEEKEADWLRLLAHRRITDGSPLMIEGELTIEVAGSIREVDLGTFTLKGAALVRLASDLPFRVDSEGHVHVQVRPGSHTLAWASYSELVRGPLLAPQDTGADWPKQEFWSFSKDDAFRQVRIEGVSDVEPSQTSIPQNWQALPAYRIEAKSEFKFRTDTRGISEKRDNEFSLSRELWLDAESKGLTGRDTIQGSMKRDWRLDMKMRNAKLGRVQVNGDSALITENGEASGVEIRRASPNIRADWRMKTFRGALPANGWSTKMGSAAATLHMPPGHSLLWASGPDQVHGDWLGKWTLWSIFFAILCIAITFRVFGIAPALLLALFLLVSYFETHVPRLSWILLAILSVASRFLPNDSHKKELTIWYKIALGAVFLVSIPFLITQYRFAEYPFANYYQGSWDSVVFGILLAAAGMRVVWALFRSGQGIGKAVLKSSLVIGALLLVAVVGIGVWSSFGGRVQEKVRSGAVEIGALQEEEQMANIPESPMELANDESFGLDSLSGSKGGSLRNRGKRAKKQMKANFANVTSQGYQYDELTNIQTGPGIPKLEQGDVARFTWNGVVADGESLSIATLSPPMHRGLALFRILLLLSLLLLIGRQTLERQRRIATKAAASLALFAIFLPQPVSAQPPAEVLQQLNQRLTRAPGCGGECSQINKLNIDAKGKKVGIELEAHALTDTVVRIPGPADKWTPEVIRVDGKEAAARIDENGFIIVRVSKGIHRIQAESRSAGNVEFTFAQRPKLVDVKTKGWSVAGVRGRNDFEDLLVISPTGQTIPSAENDVGEDDEDGEPLAADGGAAVSLDTWYLIKRTFYLGINWTVTTEVVRVGPKTNARVVNVKLLPGENIKSSEVSASADGKHVRVAFNAGEDQVIWQSGINPGPAIELTAPAGAKRSVTWSVECGPQWHCSYSGVKATEELQGQHLMPDFRPWPGENLKIEVGQPMAAKGQSSTIDSADLYFTEGERWNSYQLNLDIRASVPTMRTISVGKNYEGLHVAINGSSARVQEDAEGIRLSLRRGKSNVVMKWKSPRDENGFITRTPAVKVDGEIVNATTSIDTPHSRWVLWFSGDGNGPHIFFWSYLLFLLVLAFALRRFISAPLGIVDWTLLLLGISQRSLTEISIVVLLFALLAWRRQQTLDKKIEVLRQTWLPFHAFIAVFVLGISIESGLMGSPDMMIAGQLEWYVDRAAGLLPQVTMISVPIWFWRAWMLIWSLWLAFRLISWSRWAFESWTMNDGLAVFRAEPKDEKVSAVQQESTEMADAVTASVEDAEAAPASKSPTLNETRDESVNTPIEALRKPRAESDDDGSDDDGSDDDGTDNKDS